MRSLLLHGDIDALSGSDQAGGLSDAETPLQIELGCCTMLRSDLGRLTDGVVLSLDTPAGDPVSLYAGDRLIARAELLVHDGCLCARILEVVPHEEIP